MKTYTFHVHGMHCPSCVVLAETKLTELDTVHSAKASLHSRSIELVGDFGEQEASVIALELSKVLTQHGYSLSTEQEVQNKKWSDFKIAAPMALIFGLLFFWLQKSGLLNSFTVGSLSYSSDFVIGVIASLSSCMAVVGGLVLSLSATSSHESIRGGSNSNCSMVFFHGGRLISFFVLGGVIGLIGSAFTLGIKVTVLLNSAIALVMLVLGLNLLDVFHFAKKLQPAMPKFISRHSLSLAKFNRGPAPFLLGAATFFLPCGFTQAMQISTLKAGGFLTGGLTMLVFALGTLPVLGLVSFGFSGLKSESKKSIFFKTAGLIVILFALVNLLSAMALLGVMPPLLNF